MGYWTRDELKWFNFFAYIFGCFCCKSVTGKNFEILEYICQDEYESVGDTAFYYHQECVKFVLENPEEHSNTMIDQALKIDELRSRIPFEKDLKKITYDRDREILLKKVRATRSL